MFCCYLCLGIADHHYDAGFHRQRNMSLSILKELGFGKDIMEERIQVEVSVLLQKIRAMKSEAFCPDSAIVPCTLNVTVSIAFGRRMDDKVIGEVAKVTYDFAQALLNAAAADVFPLLRFIPQMRRRIAAMVDLQNQVFDIMRNNIETADEDSFVRYYENREGSKLDREQLEYIVRDLFLGSSETINSTLLWAMVFLAGRDGQRIQERLWKEIDAHVPRGRLPSFADRPHMPFVEATILEVMRVKTVGPLALSHWTSCDTTVGGFFIPANTQASVSAIYTEGSRKNAQSLVCRHFATVCSGIAQFSPKCSDINW